MPYNKEFGRGQSIRTSGRMVFLEGYEGEPGGPRRVSVMFDAGEFGGASIEYSSGTVEVAAGSGRVKAWFSGDNNVQFTLDDIQEAVDAAVSDS